MAKYLALLRAVNVGGRNVPTTTLKDCFMRAGFSNVSSYIQTGNVFFETDARDRDKLTEQIEGMLKTSFGFEIVTILKSPSELRQIISNCPFNKQELGETYKRYVSFLDRPAPKAKLSELMSVQNEWLHFYAGAQVIYVALRADAPKPVFDNGFIEKTLGLVATARNWNVSIKLAELASS